MNPVHVRICRCGLPMTRGRCPHCDHPDKCPPGCVPCLVRDSTCPLCDTHCGTPAAEYYHEKACRARERLAETKRQEDR